MTRFNYKAVPTNNTDYSCHTKPVKLALPIIWGPYHATSHEHTDTQIHIYTHFIHGQGQLLETRCAPCLKILSLNSLAVYNMYTHTYVCNK